ncbi:TOBE domain-containing protein, partial [Lentimicrobium sp.]|uniref:TOBE domain-containing protein n=2 Tax=Lentimicrobium sp. TaxID=2034841 RepID=UPI002CF7B06A
SIMKISARNQIKGVITEIKPGVVTARVILDIGGGNRLSSVITMESVQELNLKPGDVVYAIIKSTEVMIGKE